MNKRFFHKHFRKIVVVLTTLTLLLLLFWQATATLNAVKADHTQPVKYGTTFTPSQAAALGLDWKETYNALLTDLNIKRFRLVSFWNVIEPAPGQYDFSELDYEIAQAKAHNAEVTLSVGLRQPRYPECHAPDWAQKLDKSQHDAALLTFVTQVVNHYKNNSTVTSWQLENEALNTVFGVCAKYDRNLLVKEFNTVKGLDPSRPVVMSVSNEYGLPLGQPRPDQFSLSVYRIVWDTTFTHNYFFYPFTPQFHGLRAGIIERLLHRSVIIGELQAEPWGKGWIGDMSLAEQNKSMDADKLKKIVQYARDTGLNTMDLWGSEWWYWRLKHGDPSVWQAAKEIYAS